VHYPRYRTPAEHDVQEDAPVVLENVPEEHGVQADAFVLLANVPEFMNILKVAPYY
jgi:hypothetical protein